MYMSKLGILSELTSTKRIFIRPRLRGDRFKFVPPDTPVFTFFIATKKHSNIGNIRIMTCDYVPSYVSHQQTQVMIPAVLCTCNPAVMDYWSNLQGFPEECDKLLGYDLGNMKQMASMLNMGICCVTTVFCDTETRSIEHEIFFAPKDR